MFRKNPNRVPNIKIYDFLSELSTWKHTPLDVLAKAQNIDEQKLMRGVDITEINILLKHWKKGVYDEDVDILWDRLICIISTYKML